MEKLFERLGRTSDHRDGVSSASTSETIHSGRSKQQLESAVGLENDDLFGLFQLWPLKSQGHEVDETQIE